MCDYWEWKENTFLGSCLARWHEAKRCCTAYLQAFSKEEHHGVQSFGSRFWVSQINTQEGLSVDHIQQFYKLWEMLANVQLDNETKDSITWKFTNNGCYSAKSVYNMQFLGLTTSTMPSLFGSLGLRQNAKLLIG
jgi:hypothetical protein